MLFERFLSQKATRISLLLLIVGLFAFLNFALPHIHYLHKPTKKDPGPYITRLILRFVSHEEKAGLKNYKVFIQKGWLPLKRFTLLSGNCVQQLHFVGVAGEYLEYPLEGYCKSSKPREIIVPEQFQDKSFQLSFDLRLDGNRSSYRLQTFMGWPFVSVYVTLIALIALLFFSILRSEERSIRYFLPIAFTLYMSNFIVLDYDQWGYDAVGHLEHVKLVLKGILIPKDICWECFQPPFAYWLAASFYRVANDVLGLASATRIVSVVFFLSFLYYGMKYLQLFCPKQKVHRALFMFLIVFLPASIIHALRVGNDTVFYAFFMAALFYLSRSLLTIPLNFSDLKKFSWASVFALFSKATALVFYPFLIAAFTAQIVFKPKQRYFYVQQWKRVLLALAPFLLALPVFLSMQNYKVDFSKRLGTMNQQLWIKDGWINRLGVDITDFFREPFVHPWRDTGGRQYFLNYYFKTASWAEFNWGRDIHNLALFWNYFCVFAIFYFLIGAYQKKIYLKDVYLPLGAFLTCFAAAFYYRMNYSYSSVQDFRFLFPVIFPVSVLLLKASEAYKASLVRGVLFVGCFLLTNVWIVIFLRARN